jgi:hypothetical protein
MKTPNVFVSLGAGGGDEFCKIKLFSSLHFLPGLMF